ncbi:hypothetical protein J4G33_12230 [Actinotalea sp. BY-33]|uniref:DUF1579 domain-containing protein n=2 Tax=Actinotalea soli TaxID=2819234 RepID=A0A939LQE1_9CELL|nr:hypothetical protein [Actinotalea soli]
MSSLPGTWDLAMRSPIGTITATMHFVADGDTLTGVATGRDEQVPLRDVRVETGPGGERVTWSQSITRPMRLNLEFEVIVTGDHMEGHSRAGRLPRTSVTGRRVPTP